MELTDSEQAMLDGESGPGAQLAMKVQVAVGDAYGAPRMVPISRAHVALSNQEADLWFAEKMAGLGARCVVRPTTNPSFNWQQMKRVTDIDPADEEMVKRTHEAYVSLGALMTYDCTPYQERNVPAFGEVISFSESSATPYVNSVYGARSNRESAQSALCAAITGVVPYYGLLREEERLGQVLVHVEADMKDDFDYQLLGYVAPRFIGMDLPVFEGLDNPSPAALKNLCAQLNTGGNVAMFHIVGVTPEAPTREAAFGGRPVAREVTITRQHLDAMAAELSARSGKVDFALFGCPHLSVDQVATIATMVKGKRLTVPLYAMTSSLTYNLSENMGYLEQIREAGGEIFSNTCMDQPVWKFLEGKTGATESPKCAYYTKMRGMDFIITSLESAVAGALTGEVAA